MDKSKILERARQEKRKGQEYENREMMKNSNWSLLVGVIAAAIMMLIEYLNQGTVNSPLIVMVSAMAGVMNFLDGIKVKKKVLIILGILESVLAIFFFVYFLSRVV